MCPSFNTEDGIGRATTRNVSTDDVFTHLRFNTEDGIGRATTLCP